jgi:sugar phosphate isomerase/epimerase
VGLDNSDLVLCSGTLPRNTTFAQRLAAARAGGYAAISLWGRDCAAAADEGLSLQAMHTMLEDHGLAVAEIDPAWWWTPGATDFTIPPELDPVGIFAYGADELCHIAEVLGARSLNAADVLGGSWNVEQGAEAFAALCDRAAEHGLLVHLEWLAWSKVPDLHSALQIVTGADRPNGGLNVDTWHCGRTGTTPQDLRGLDGERVFAIQLDDAPAQVEADLIDATLHHRLLPGHGALDLVGYLGALADIEVHCPVGVEVFSDALHDSGPEVAARSAAEATRAVLDAAQWHRP